MSGPSGKDNDWRPEPRPAPRPKGNDNGGGGNPPPDPCNVVEITNLNSVDRNVVAGLRPGDLLSVVFQPGPPQRLVAQTQAGLTAGSITSQSMLQIIQCIQSGVSYTAEIISIRGAQCQIQIQPV